MALQRSLTSRLRIDPDGWIETSAPGLPPRPSEPRAIDRGFDYHRAMAQADSPSAHAEALERVRQFLAAGLQHATIATVNADGSPHQALTWCRLDGNTLVINSAAGRIWPANLRRDPRISVTLADGPRWIAIRGSVEVVDERASAQADIAAMARQYHADEPGRAEELIRDRFERQQRVSFRLSLTSSTFHFED